MGNGIAVQRAPLPLAAVLALQLGECSVRNLPAMQQKLVVQCCGSDQRPSWVLTELLIERFG
jgi:hypothetical protein